MSRKWWSAAAVAIVISVASPAVASATQAPGSVVESAVLQRDLWIPGTADAQTLTYWSTGPQGQPMLSSGALFLPEGSPPAGGWPVVAWAHGTVGMGDECAPSTTRRSDRDLAYLSHWLRQGYAIVATDYVGLGTPGVHPYLDGRTAAYSVADSVRAGRALVPELANKWVAIGQSQGGHAAMFTARIAPEYAPDLDFRGAVGTGVPSNLEGPLTLAGPYVPRLPLSGTTIYLAFVLAALRADDPQLDVNSYLTPHGRDVLDRVENLCYQGASDLLENTSIGALLARPLADPRMSSALNEMLAVPTSGYQRPVFIGQGIADAVVPVPLTTKLAADMSLGATDLTFRIYPRGHNETMADSLPDTTPFVARLLR